MVVLNIADSQSQIGGLAIGLVRTGNIITAAAFATVAASFAIEQIGIPTLSNNNAEAVNELWNDVSVQERLNCYMDRLRRLKITG